MIKPLINNNSQIKKRSKITLDLRRPVCLIGLTFIFVILPCATWAKTNKLTLWTSSENVARAIEQLTPAFEKEFHIQVEVNILNKDLTTQFKTAAIAGKGPDIFCWANDVIGELATSGLIEPIHLSSKQRSKFLKTALDSFTYNGQLYGYPYDIESVALIINKNLLPKNPRSMEELLSWSKNFQQKNPDKFGFLFDLKNFYFNFGLLSAGGGYVFGPDKYFPAKLDPKNIGLDNKGAVAGVNYLKSLVKEGVIPTSTNRNIAFERFLKGKVAATIDGPWAIKDIQKAKIPYDVLSIPTLGGGHPRPFVGTHGFIVRRNSINKELAKELIEKYLVTDQAMSILYKEDPRGPSRKGSLKILKNELNTEDLHVLNQFFESAAGGIPMPNLSEMAPVWSAMGSAYDLIFNNDVDPKRALHQAKDNILLAIKDHQNENK